MARSLALALGCSLVASGCLDSRFEADLDLERAVVVTPYGRIVPADVDDSHHVAQVTSGLRLLVAIRGVVMRLDPFGKVAEFSVETRPPESIVEFDREGVRYSRDGDDLVPVSARQNPSPSATRVPQKPTLFLELGPEIQRIEVRNIDSLARDTQRAIEAQEGVDHRLYLPFSIDGEPYALDIEFELGLERHWKFNVVGTP